MSRTPVVALDLDGVLVDSARECFEILSESAPDLVPEAVRERWLRERGRARIVADFFRLARAVEEGVDLPAEGGLPSDLAYPPDVEDRVTRFYETRARRRTVDPEGWFGLHRAFPGAPEAVAAIGTRAEVWVATSKDTRSSAALLERFGYAVPSDRVLGREAGDGKAVLLRAVAAGAGVGTAEITFVDDHLENLRTAAGTGARCVMAAWGYGVAGEREQAAREGFPVLELVDFGGLPAIPGRA